MPEQPPPRPRIAIIVSSTRPGRFADTVVNWLSGQLHGTTDSELDIIDLRDLDLPVAWQGATNGRYGSEQLQDFSRRVDAADAFIIVTPEYNHAYPASVKVALDALGSEWQAKPVSFVSYGGISGGIRAVEQLRLVVAELHMVDIRNGISFHMAWGAFNNDGVPHDAERYAKAAKQMLRQLEWWMEALRAARAAMPYVA